jgi:membrane-associated protease RseP (regulator of RpoE activity)
MHTIGLRCKKATILQSIARVPPMSLEGKTLKMCQVQIAPDSKGFGLDLTDFNGIAGVAPGGAASRSDISIGDVIVGVDGIDIGVRRLVEVLVRGKTSYVFTVIRPLEKLTEDTDDWVSSAHLACTRCFSGLYCCGFVEYLSQGSVHTRVTTGGGS